MSGTSTDLAISLSVRMGNMEAKLRETTEELRKTDRATKETQRGLAGLGATATATAGAMSRLGASMTGAAAGVRAAGATITATTTAMTGAFAGLMTILAPMIALFAALGVVSGIGAALSSISSLGDEAESVGLTANQLLGLRTAFEEAGGSAGQATVSITKFNDLVGDAARGNREAMQTMYDLGISYRNTDGSVRTTAQTFESAIASIQRATTEQEKLSRAGELFGQRNARIVVAALGNMEGGLEGLVTKLREAGVVLNENTAPAIDRLGEKFQQMGRTISVAIANAIAGSEPQITSFIERVTRGIIAVINYIENAGVRSAQQHDPRQRLLDDEAAQAAVRLADARRRLSAVEAEAASGSIIEGLYRRTREAIDAETLALRRNIPELERQREAALQARNARAEGTRALVTLPGDVDGSRGQVPPPAAPTPTAADPVRPPPTSTPVDREARQAVRLLERLADQQRRPVEELQHNLTEAGDAITRLGATAVVGYETLARAAENGAREAIEASQGIKGEADSAAEASIAAAEAFGQRMVLIGRMSAEQYEAMMARVRDASANAMQSAGKASEGTTGFWGALSTSMGGNQMGLQSDFGTTVGKGLGDQLVGSLDTIANLMNKVADGSISAGDAIKSFALDFVQAVAMMIAKAAALQAIQLILSSFSGGKGGGYSLVGPPPTGVPGFMAGGAVAGGHMILVGERGPELFTPPGAGRIVANHDLAGRGTQVNIVNNAPGVVVEERSNQDGVVALAVTLSRQRIAADFGESARTGYGPYAEPLNARYAMRRRS